MNKKNRHSLTRFVLLVLLLLNILCVLPENPEDPSNTSAGIIMRASRWNVESDTLIDTAGNTIEIGVALNLPENFDSVSLEIREQDSLVFDTMFTVFTSDLRDTVWSRLVFYSAGKRTVTAIFYSSVDLPPITATISIIGRKFALNHPPVITVSGDRIVRPETVCTLTVTSTDADVEQEVEIRLVKGPEGSELKHDSLFIWEIPEDAIGHGTIIFIGTDNGAPPQSDTDTVIVTVTTTPHAPVLSVEGDTRIAPEEICSLYIAVSDEDDDQEYVLEMSEAPEDAELIGDSLFIWQAPESYHGTATVTFTATDNGSPPLSTTQLVMISVSRPGNHAPTWTLDTITITINEKNDYQLQLEPLCNDSDDDKLTFALLGGPPSQDRIENSTYTLAMDASLTGNYSILIVAADADVEYDTLVMMLSIESSEDDTTAPVVTILHPASDSLITGKDSLRIDLICSDASGIASLKVKYDDNERSFAKGDAYYSAPITDIPADSFLKVTVTAVDSSGNANRYSHTLYLKYDPTMNDTTGPEITLVDPEDDSARVNTSSVQISVSAIDDNGIGSLVALVDNDEIDVDAEDSVYSVILDDLSSDTFTIVTFIATDNSYNGNSETLSVSLRYQPLYPDLVVESISVDPETVLTGDSARIIVTIHNQGEAVASASHASVTIGDEDPQTFDVPALAVDSSFVLQLNELFSTEQTVTITAQADTDNEVEESDEENNSGEQELPVTEMPEPNLVIQTLEFNPETPTNSDSVTITVTVHNSGNAAAETTTLSITAGDEDEPSLHDVQALTADSSTVITRRVLFRTAGSFTIIATIDPENIITESSETDNEEQGSITVTQTLQSNLVIKDFSFTPQQPDNEAPVTFSVTVANNGDAPASASELTIKLGGEASPATFDVPSLPEGEEYTVTRDSLFSVVGDYLATAVADAGDDVEESNENDNQDQITVAVVQAPQPDLTVSSVTVSPDAPTVDDTIIITINMESGGNGDAAESQVEVTVGGQTPVLVDVPALDAGDSYAATWNTIITTAGPCTVSVTADNGDVLEESDETNNTGTLVFNVTLADLEVDEFTMSPSWPTTGDTITFSATVQNTGDGTAHASRLAIKVGGGSPVLFAVPSLLAGASSTITRKVLLNASGNYSASALADSGGVVTESDETNNTASLTFTVALRMIAAYPLLYDADDSLGRNNPMTLTGTPFVTGGITCNGIYINSGDPDSCNATTPVISTLDLTSFSIVAEFKIDSFPDQDVPVFVGGTSYRWMGFILAADSTITLKYNNSSYSTSTVTYTTGEWHEAKITYDGTTGSCYFDGALACSEDFTLTHGNNRNISITDFSSGRTFRGTFRNLRVYESAAGTTLIARYPLMRNANEISGRYAAMTLTNTPFVTTGKGIICSGDYAGTTVITPSLSDLDFSDLSITFNYYLPVLPATRMPVIVGGRLYRWLGFFVEPDGSITMMHTNSTNVPGTRSCTAGTWYKGEVRYNAATGRGQVLLDDAVAASATFDLEHGNANRVTVSHYGNGSTFGGIISDLKIYSK